MVDMDGRETLAYEHWTNGNLIALQATIEEHVRDLHRIYNSCDSVGKALLSETIEKHENSLENISLEIRHRERVTGKTGLVVWPPELDFLTLYPHTTSAHTQETLSRRKL
jgi:hypothetical protein